MFGIGYPELIVLGIVAVVLFGKRLPEVARSVGSSYQQFKKGLSDLQTSIEVDDYEPSNSLPDYSDQYEQDQPAGPRFQVPAEEKSESET